MGAGRLLAVEALPKDPGAMEEDPIRLLVEVSPLYGAVLFRDGPVVGPGRAPNVEVSVPPGTPNPVWLSEAALPDTSLEPLNALPVARAVSALEAMAPLAEEEFLLVDVEALVAEASFTFPTAFDASAW